MEIFRANRGMVWGVIGAGVATVSVCALWRSMRNYKKQIQMLKEENNLLHLEINTAVNGWIKAEGREVALQEQLEVKDTMLKTAIAAKAEQVKLLKDQHNLAIRKLVGQTRILKRDLRTSKEKLHDAIKIMGSAEDLNCQR